MRKIFRWSKQEGKLLPLDEWLAKYSEDGNKAAMIMPDIKPYKSMIDGTLITSRSRHRAHLKQHNCIEVGNDSSVLNPKPKQLTSPPGLKKTLIRLANEKLRWE